MKKFFAFSQVMLALCIVCSCSESSDEDRHSSAQLIVNGHKFVDLGLPSGLLWAETNIGAASSADDGDYFAWGETCSKTTYSWDTYKWGSSSNFSKYNYSDNKKTLEAADDAATVNWGTPCRMPDSSDFQELYDECNWSWKSSYNGASGYLVTGPNGNTIFLPASGYRCNGDLNYHGSNGFYWSRSLYSSGTNNARSLNFGGGNVYPTYGSGRYYGFAVRPVAEQ